MFACISSIIVRALTSAKTIFESTCHLQINND